MLGCRRPNENTQSSVCQVVCETLSFFSSFFFPFFFFFLIFFSCHPSFLVDGSVVNMPLALSSALQPECRPLHVGWLAKPYPQYFWR